jgi:hypothetical protein
MGGGVGSHLLEVCRRGAAHGSGGRRQHGGGDGSERLKQGDEGKLGQTGPFRATRASCELDQLQEKLKKKVMGRRESWAEKCSQAEVKIGLEGKIEIGFQIYSRLLDSKSKDSKYFLN